MKNDKNVKEWLLKNIKNSRNYNLICVRFWGKQESDINGEHERKVCDIDGEQDYEVLWDVEWQVWGICE